MVLGLLILLYLSRKAAYLVHVLAAYIYALVFSIIEGALKRNVLSSSSVLTCLGKHVVLMFSLVQLQLWVWLVL